MPKCKRIIEDESDIEYEKTVPKNERKSNLKDDQIIRDQLIPTIYVRKIEKSKITAGGKRKKTDRYQNSSHSCLYCGKALPAYP